LEVSDNASLELVELVRGSRASAVIHRSTRTLDRLMAGPGEVAEPARPWSGEGLGVAAIDLVRASRIMLSPNSNSLPKS
jgi:hypothetical protein